MRLETNGEGYFMYRIPGLVMTEKGTLLAYYECRDTQSDWANIDIKVSRSTDGGATWETVLVFHEERTTLNNPVMIIDGETVHFLYCRNYRELFYCKSTDDGVSFSAPVNKSETFERAGFFYNVAAVGPGHGIRHRGNLLVPVWFACNRDRPKAHHPSFISTIVSSDGGESFRVGERIGDELFRNPSECALAITPDGRVLNSIRNENPERCRGLAISDDGFSDWQDVHLEASLPDPVCMGSMTHRDGTIYHINCESKTARENLTVKVSRDGMKSFERIPVDRITAYSDVAVSEDTLYILYEGENGLYFRAIKTDQISDLSDHSVIPSAI